MLSQGYHIVRASGNELEKAKTFAFSEEECRSLMRIEHDIWLRDCLLNGYEWAENSNSSLRLNRDIALFEEVPPGDQQLDLVIVESVPAVLIKHGYILIKK